MLTVSLNEIQNDPLKYLRQVEAGVAFIITSADKPIAEIRPIKPIPNPIKQRRPIGLCEGEFVVPDDFNDPLPEEWLALFEGQ